MEENQKPAGTTLEHDPTQPLPREAAEAAYEQPVPEESAPNADWPPALPGYPPTPSGSSETTGEAAGQDPPRRGGRLAPLFLAALLGAVLGTGATLVAANRFDGGTINVVKPPVPDGKGVKLEGVAAVADAVTPSIVHIRTRVQSNFFGAEQTASGSGVIYRSDGYIITNNHVVQGASSVEVTLSTGQTLEGRVVGSAAPVDDIAVVKIDRQGLPAATLGTIKGLKVGESAIAIGSPFGLQSTVTAGIVSALHRSLNLGEVAFTEAIQTDAPINPGNSGGALANARGEVIGINTAILGNSGGNVGIGFAIPIDIAKRDADEIIETGRARRPLLGILPETIPGTSGAYISQVTRGAPAAAAGIEVGDVITKLNDTVVENAEDLILQISSFRVGDKVRVTYKRGNETRTAIVTLIARS